MNDAERLNRHSWVRAAVEQFEGPLVRYAAQLSGNVETAREVVQDTTPDPGYWDSRSRLTFMK